ncbi:MAG: hypothetical protein JWN14_3837 [Chthonomonadales bacterium]|nr:hypothetical protein [Chthonomonadales bacterium]
MQKLGQTFVFLLVFVGVGLLCFYLAAPHILPPTSGQGTSVPPPAPDPTTAPSPTAPTFTPSSAPTLPTTRIAPPRSATQRESDDIEARRAPYYQWLHSTFGDVLTAQQASSSDQATLDLYTSRSDSTLVLSLLGRAIQPYADRYGFNHVRFFMPNPAGSVERYRFAAEASPASDGTWNAFEK